ncbi:MAG: cyclic nucleotide-binding domain-containing protein [Burkholderiales bacterium]|nr:cyclic nucleotide-binding domain-containing protein [Burkholderiales bacterium]
MSISPARPDEEELRAAVSFFSELGEEEARRLLRILTPVEYAAGARLVRQGQPADGAYIIVSGSAEALTALPGGGEASVARLGPGSVLGEMALLDSGVRSATVVARTALRGYFVDRETFRLLLAQRERAAFAIRNRITRTLCRRLRELNAKFVAAGSAGGARPIAAQAPGPTRLQRGSCSFDYRRFLPLLPVFSAFRAEEIDAFVARTEIVEVSRGEALFRQGDPGTSAFVVVRGALEVDHAAAGQRQRIGILGPGRLCGVLALIEGRGHSLSAAARENTTLLEIHTREFEALFNGVDMTATKFRDAIDRELLKSFARTNNHLTRLISQAVIRGGKRASSKAEQLQLALAGVDCETR